jgi:hypothetical protein
VADGGVSETARAIGPRAIVAVLLVVGCLAAIVAVRLLTAGPSVDCSAISADDCHRAVDLARPLLSAEWEKASQVTVHTGPCSRAMKCPASTVANPGFLTVELTDPGVTPFVVIDRRQGVWKAACRVMVYSGNSGSLQPCGS